MNLVSTIFFLIMLTSCDSYAPGGPLNQKPDYTQMYNQFSKKTLNSITEKYQLSIRSSGGSFMDEIHSVSYGFSSNKQATRDEARALIVQVTEDLIREVNAYKELRPHLANYPLDNKNFTLTISFYDPSTQERRGPPYITMVTNGPRGINYDDKGYVDIFNISADETYEEAKRKVDAYLAQPGR
jgi:hypothetical protein